MLAAAAQRNEAPEAIINAALGEHLHDEPAQDEAAQEADYQGEQSRLRRLLLAATEEAKMVKPEPFDFPARTYYRESEYGKLLAEKFRKQGLNVD